MGKIRIRVPEVSYVTLEVETPIPYPQYAFEHVYNGGDFAIVDGPEFSHFLSPDYGSRGGKWSLVNEDGEDIEYVRIYKPEVHDFIWVPDAEAKPGYGY